MLPGARRWCARRLALPTEAITVVDGAPDAISRMLERRVRFGDRVARRVPRLPAGLRPARACSAPSVVPLRSTSRACGRTRSRRALTAAPPSVLLQPRAQNPTGMSMTPPRASKLARGPPGAQRAAHGHRGRPLGGDLLLGRHASATYLPERVVHVRSSQVARPRPAHRRPRRARASLSTRSLRAACSGRAGPRRMLQHDPARPAHRGRVDRRGGEARRQSLLPAARPDRRRCRAGHPGRARPTASTSGCRCATNGPPWCSSPPPASASRRQPVRRRGHLPGDPCSRRSCHARQRPRPRHRRPARPPRSTTSPARWPWRRAPDAFEGGRRHSRALTGSRAASS